MSSRSNRTNRINQGARQVAQASDALAPIAMGVATKVACQEWILIKES